MNDWTRGTIVCTYRPPQLQVGHPFMDFVDVFQSVPGKSPLSKASYSQGEVQLSDHCCSPVLSCRTLAAVFWLGAGWVTTCHSKSRKKGKLVNKCVWQYIIFLRYKKRKFCFSNIYPLIIFRFYGCCYVWGQIEPNNLNKRTIIEIQIFGHFCSHLLIVSKITSLLSKKSVRNISF